MFIKISVTWNVQLGMCVPFRSASNFKIYKTAVSIYVHCSLPYAHRFPHRFDHWLSTLCVSITISSSTEFFKKVGHKFE